MLAYLQNISQRIQSLIKNANCFTLKTKLILGFVLLMLIALAVNQCKPRPTVSKASFSTPPQIKNMSTARVPVSVKTVMVLPKSKVAKTLPLPANIVEDEDIEITDTAELPPTENGTKVVATINTQTGNTNLVARENSAPFFAFESKKRIGAGYGVGTNGTEAKVFGEWSFLRIGNLHVGTQAEVAVHTVQAPDAKVFAIIDYRF